MFCYKFSLFRNLFFVVENVYFIVIIYCVELNIRYLAKKLLVQELLRKCEKTVIGIDYRLRLNFEFVAVVRNCDQVEFTRSK